MIFNKYQFINYNGLREDAMQLIESQGDGKMVVIFLIIKLLSLTKFTILLVEL